MHAVQKHIGLLYLIEVRKGEGKAHNNNLNRDSNAKPRLRSHACLGCVTQGHTARHRTTELIKLKLVLS